MKSRLPSFLAGSIFVLLSFLPEAHPAPGAKVREIAVTVDTRETPALAPWAATACALVRRWYPRICNLLPSRGFNPPNAVALIFRKSNRGVAGTCGTRITISSHWVEAHPDDIGFVIHELTHVVQNYGDCRGSWWITEGIADYIRWAIFEGKPLAWFPRPNTADGYKQGYRATAGFLLWLESGEAPGIVKRLNTAMRRNRYREALFKQTAGRSLPALWKAYLADMKRAGARGR